MKKYIKWILLITLFLVAGGGIWAVTNPKAALEIFVDFGGINEGEGMPLITGTEVNGETTSLEKFKGEKYVLMVGKVDCEVCQKTYPVLKNLKNEHPKTNFIMIGQGDKNEYAQTKQKNGFEFPIISADSKISEEMNLKIYPVFYLVNEKGEVEKRSNGFEEPELQEMLRKAEKK
ncbi:TlpA disulfide reductase family protein [Bacillus paramycoides]|uniref:TlpA family protein disulfide reductase n=1 Tax=Bacillus paramycoides TaxID=2026194 RepID=UPI002E1E19EB|nr:TlpA disulfide reductase family protein [Bacillus paramycoides]